MSYITHSGYGYSKKLCKDIAEWFVSKYYPRHKLDIDIVHRSLKCDNVFGLCDVNGNIGSRPRAFLIDLHSNMDKELYARTLLHELTHVAQWIDGALHMKHGKLCYSQEPVENYSYQDQPHEIEARESEVILYDLWLMDRDRVPVGQVSYGFPNRLCQSSY